MRFSCKGRGLFIAKLFIAKLCLSLALLAALVRPRMADMDVVASSKGASGANPKSSPSEGARENAAGTYELPWVEKYRPVHLEDVVGNEAIVSRLAEIGKNGNMPHLLLAGPPGTGKTTSVLALARATLGRTFSKGVLELNASDDRGIDVVRTKIKQFAQQTVKLPEGMHKIVLLDEADSMTGAAQQALRRTMEIYSGTTRFALACNQSSKIIEPIQSRCAVVRFGRLTDQDIFKRLAHVLAKEGVTYDKAGIDSAVYLAEGDMRNALNNCQSCYHGFGSITAENMQKVADTPRPRVAKEFLVACLSQDINKAMSIINSLLDLGYPPIDVIKSIQGIARNDSELGTEAVRLQLLRHLGLVHMRIADGNPSTTQLAGLAARLCSIST